MDSHNLFSLSFLLILSHFFFFCFSFSSSATNFSFLSFSANDNNITVDGSAGREPFQPDNHPSIRLTRTGIRGQVFNSSGRAYYSHPIQLWNPDTNDTTDFNTSFEFQIQFTDQRANVSSGGISFFVAAEDSLPLPLNSYGGWLGLFNATNDGNSSNRIVAVEFDTYRDSWDPSNNHVGVNINSIVSEASSTWSNTMVSGDILRAQISYNGSSNELSVHLKDPQVPVDDGSLRLANRVNLKQFLPQKVFVGFSGSSGDKIAVQLIRNWNFTSTMETINDDPTGTSKTKWLAALIIALVVLGVFSIMVLVIFLSKRKKRLIREKEFDEESYIMDPMDEDFEMGTGPKRFSYRELAAATNSFSEEGKLGQGGFGGVYKGYLPESNTEIAVKKISSGSRQGKKEYISEVKTISRLRHRNLVQLIGWCHERGEFLLVYEFMPNGSLDSHIFPKKSSTNPNPALPWEARYKIVKNLASALLYLHEEWEQCVVHRDIKSSNVMLDSNFEAKLGDFGLARLVDHDPVGDQMTTVVAGTMGYMAPEYLITGKAGTESDVFSFGVVALELACGRRAVEPGAEEVSLLSKVWRLNSEGRVLEAVDESLNSDFDSVEMVRMMTVGLWCANPDHGERPSMRKAVQVLNFESALPNLPLHVPVPKFYPSLVSLSNSESFVDQSQFSSMTQSSTTTVSN